MTWSSLRSTTLMTPTRIWSSWTKSQALKAKSRSSTNAAKKKSSSPIPLRGKFGQMATRLFSSRIKMSSKHSQEGKLCTSSLTRRRRKLLSQTACKFLSFKITRSKSTSLMEQKRSVSQMAPSSVSFLMARKKASSQTARFKRLKRPGFA